MSQIQKLALSKDIYIEGAQDCFDEDMAEKMKALKEIKVVFFRKDKTAKEAWSQTRTEYQEMTSRDKRRWGAVGNARQVEHTVFQMEEFWESRQIRHKYVVVKEEGEKDTLSTLRILTAEESPRTLQLGPEY